MHKTDTQQNAPSRNQGAFHPSLFPKIYDFNNRQDYGKEGSETSGVSLWVLSVLRNCPRSYFICEGHLIYANSYVVFKKD